jgi:hypothetical protein
MFFLCVEIIARVMEVRDFTIPTVIKTKESGQCAWRDKLACHRQRIVIARNERFSTWIGGHWWHRSRRFPLR